MCLSICGDLAKWLSCSNLIDFYSFTGIESMQNSEGRDLSCGKETASQIYF